MFVVKPNSFKFFGLWCHNLAFKSEGFVVYIDTGSSMPNIPSKSHFLTDKNKKNKLMEWK